jgi:hypothetical protein
MVRMAIVDHELECVWNETRLATETISWRERWRPMRDTIACMPLPNGYFGGEAPSFGEHERPPCRWRLPRNRCIDGYDRLAIMENMVGWRSGASGGDAVVVWVRQTKTRIVPGCNDLRKLIPIVNPISVG